jgi:hypothetical protein
MDTGDHDKFFARHNAFRVCSNILASVLILKKVWKSAAGYFKPYFVSFPKLIRGVTHINIIP